VLFFERREVAEPREDIFCALSPRSRRRDSRLRGFVSSREGGKKMLFAAFKMMGLSVHCAKRTVWSKNEIQNNSFFQYTLEFNLQGNYNHF
jgi:hypothetical protein